MNLFALLLLLIVLFAVLDAIAAFLLLKLTVGTKTPRPITLVERTFVQTCIAASAAIVALPVAFALPAAFRNEIDPSLTVWLLALSLLIKSLPTGYWAWIYLRRRD